MVWCQGKTSSTDSECAGKYLTADSPEEKGPSYSICRFPWRKYSHMSNFTPLPSNQRSLKHECGAGKRWTLLVLKSQDVPAPAYTAYRPPAQFML